MKDFKTIDEQIQLFIKFYNCKDNPKLCYAYHGNKMQTQYSYSSAAIEFIYEQIKKDPEHVIRNLKNRIKIKPTPGAKEF